jgi:hypothetical protein
MQKEIIPPHIHIGAIIKAKAAERKITEVQLAKMIHCDNSTIYDIYNRRSINSEQLWKISVALEYNFFTEVYGNSLPETVSNRQDFGTTTITLFTDRIIIEQNNGIIKKTEYGRIAEK